MIYDKSLFVGNIFNNLTLWVKVVKCFSIIKKTTILGQKTR